MKQKKDKAETARAIFSKENLGFINEPDLVETSKLRLNALANALECMYIDVDDNADDSNLCTDEAQITTAIRTLKKICLADSR